MKLHSYNLGEDDQASVLTIGLFCNWSLDPRRFINFLQDQFDVTQIKGMDIPPPPANKMIVTTVKETYEIPLTEVRPFIPETCFLCPDLTAEWADVSVGMLEGREGWNTLIVRSKSGQLLVNEARQDGYIEIKPIPQEKLIHLQAAGRAKKQRALRTAIMRGVIDTKQKVDNPVFIMPREVVERLLAQS
jgi:coenzyme F420 hydrogenase subunit beta